MCRDEWNPEPHHVEGDADSIHYSITPCMRHRCIRGEEGRLRCLVCWGGWGGWRRPRSHSVAAACVWCGLSCMQSDTPHAAIPKCSCSRPCLPFHLCHLTEVLHMMCNIVELHGVSEPGAMATRAGMEPVGCEGKQCRSLSVAARLKLRCTARPA